MKIQLDTTNKIISISEDVNLKEFFIMIEALLPNFGWHEYKLQAMIVDWKDPIYVPYPVPYTPWNPPYTPWITWLSSENDSTQAYSYHTNDGIYNIATR